MTVQQLIDRLNELPRDWKVVDRTDAEIDKADISYSLSDPLFDRIDVVKLDTNAHVGVVIDDSIYEPTIEDIHELVSAIM